ncbi:MAG: hypothetical protein JOZ27_09495 [Caulobacteraceae bacterium]|nr:hypothetical protein [Caulobacteraceae bacterium]
MTAPDGWVLVPVEPTPEMIAACDGAMDAWRRTLTGDERFLRHAIVNGRKYLGTATPEEKHRIRYRAMLAAAPVWEGRVR